MKNNSIIFLFLVLLSTSISLAQSPQYSPPNVVGNADFQYEGPTFDCNGGGNSNNQNALEAMWTKYAPWTVPQKVPFHFSVGSPDFVCHDYSMPAPPAGEHMARTATDEYLCQGFTTPLNPLHSYYVEYWVLHSGGDFGASTSPGLKLLNGRPKQKGAKQLKNGYGPSTVPIPSNISTGEWTKVWGYVVIPSSVTYDWMLIGRPWRGKHDNTNGGFFYWDGFKIMDVGTSFCPEYNYIQNTYFKNIGKIVYRSEVLTTAGNHVDNTQNTGDVIIGSDAIVRFQSASLVSLMDGFGTEPGAEFEAVISPCRSECPLPLADAGPNINACSGQGTTYTLGSGEIFGQTYSWTVAEPSQVTGFPSNFNFVSLLNDPNAANPVFTQPSGYGIITYELTVTNECGQTSTSQVTINVDQNMVSSPPTLTLSLPNPYPGNFNSAQGSIDFTIGNLSNHTEYFIISIFDAGGNMVGNYEIDELNGTGQTTYHFNSFPDTYLDCGGYTAQVVQFYHCSETPSSALNVPIDPGCSNCCSNYSGVTFDYIPNIITPNGDHINDVWFIPDSPHPNCSYGGAQGFHTWIYDRWGSIIYENSSNAGVCCAYKTYINSSGAYDASIRWDGHANHGTGYSWWATHFGGHINTCNGCLISNGTYYYVQEIYRCGSTSSYAGTIECLGSPARLANPDSISHEDSLIYFSDPSYLDSIAYYQNNSTRLASTNSINETESINEKDSFVNEFVMFPNPANDKVLIYIPTSLISSSSKIEIVNSLGQTIFTEGVYEENIELNLLGLHSGMYLVRFSNNEVLQMKRLIKN